MTGADATQAAAGTPQVIDGKYRVRREVSKNGISTLYEVETASGEGRRVSWFDASKPTDRQGFHTYRQAVRAISPAGLADVVARPGAYYAVWQPVTGTPLSEALSQPVKRQEFVDAMDNLRALLATHGFALSDADIVVDGQMPRVAYLKPAPAGRTAEQIAMLNATTMTALNGGRVRKARRPREPGAWLAFIPGLLFLGGAGWLGAQAAQVYLNPPIGEVKNVTGKPASEAAKQLTGDGFRVEYTYGDSGGVPVGAVIRQDPDPGTALPTGRLVSLTVNNPAPLTVPKLEDLTLQQAQAPLKDNALKLGKVIKVDGTLSNTPAGRVIAQVPAPGATIQRGQPVQVMVSTGVKGRETWIPNLEGMTFEQARAHARAAGLVVTEVKKEPSDRAENIVLRQEPKPFVRVDVGSRVILVISTAKFTPPSTPTAPLPIPPPYVPPPPPVEPEPGTGATPDSSVTDPTPNDGQGAVTIPAVPDNTQTPPDTQPINQNQTPAEIPPTPASNGARPVNFAYVFPAGLPAGSYSVVVQDADGERQMMPPTDSTQLAGQQANASATVRGNAVFIIRVNGAEYARVNPQ
ncbi:PASTA domain-containing protein [Deinococcus fonticola]|uniref:PASTA domain-containing protein n=1 Tax=Deinococcus fonticola TaxID=2528713 RepID=UPI0010754C09|nr:PASTA domain-containing protein [Deinococcus fonticola]